MEVWVMSDSTDDKIIEHDRQRLVFRIPPAFGRVVSTCRYQNSLIVACENGVLRWNLDSDTFNNVEI